VLLAAGQARLQFLLTAGALAVLLCGGVALGSLLGATGVALASAGSAVTLAALRLASCVRLVVRRPPRWIAEALLFGALAGLLAVLAGWSMPQRDAAGSAFSAALYAVIYLGLLRVKHGPGYLASLILRPQPPSGGERILRDLT
jgi:O-antigen/teichoic acid export membrane protein